MLIDVREFPEFASGHIAGARLVPLATLATVSSSWNKTEPITLICKSGRRAELARQQLQALGFTSLTVLPGGMDGWREQGKAVGVEEHRPWSLERQVRTVAGSLVLVTLALGFFVSSYFLLVTAFVGAGLVVAGITDTCLMANILGRMPWNRPGPVAG